MGNYTGAKSTLTDAIAIDPKNGDAYFYRGEANYNLKKEKDACSDWKVSSELEFDLADEALEKYCK
jgi:Tfp pilus assembly protein PilF